jgi:hypothetical protein
MAVFEGKICAARFFFVPLHCQNQGSLTAPRDSLIATRISLKTEIISCITGPNQLYKIRY